MAESLGNTTATKVSGHEGAMMMKDVVSGVDGGMRCRLQVSPDEREDR